MSTATVEEVLRTVKAEQGEMPVEILRLPADAVESAANGAARATAVLEPVAGWAERLAAFCEARGVALDAVLLCGFVAVLRRVTEQEEVLIGCAVEHGALHAAGVVALQVALDESTRFTDLLREVERSLEETEGRLEKAGEFVVEGAAMPVPVVFLGEVAGELPARVAVDAELACGFERVGDGLRLTAWYATALFRATTAERVLRLMERLLESAVAAPETAVDRLVLTDAAERAALLTVCVGPVLELGAFEPVQAVVRRWAEREPGRLAVECGGSTLTYGELVERAAAIAARMMAEGIGPRRRVALCLARSTEMPAALLAVLLCGCTYVPLDPLFPLERMTAVLEDAKAALLLTDGSAAVPGDVPVLDLRSVGSAAAGPLPTVEVRAEDAAYVIYTSGSTGRPKGVVIGHGALRSMLCAAAVTPGFTADDALVAITTLTFDISVMDMWLPLWFGGRLVVATYEESRNPPGLEALLNRSGATVPGTAGPGVTVLAATPGFWRAMVEHGWTTHAPGAARVRVMCGGEAMPRDLADALLERCDDVWNMYGPTECTVWVTATRVRAGSVPPGVDAAMANCAMFVVDGGLQPVPAGVTGELVIGGGHVGLGYWNRPELTAAMFVRNPFGPGMLYRTGDLAQVRPEGGLRLLGRSDFQVKVRGFRIELGEIEHVLEEHPAVREAVVVQQTVPALPGMPVQKPLVAFVDVGHGFAESGFAGLVRELEAELRRALPEYMVPAGTVVLPGLPRLFNGKVNRKALPVFAPAVVEEMYVAPRDFLERQVAQIWQGTLGIERIGIETSYFALGVDSLTALRLINRVNGTFAVQLGLANLLTANSIAAMAAAIRDQHAPSVERALVPLRTAGTKCPLFLVHGVGGNILNFIGLAGQMRDDQPVYALQAQALLTGQAALLRLEDMAAYYVREVREVQARGPYHLLGYSFGGTVVVEMARQLREAGETVALVAMLDARTLQFERAHRDSMGAQMAARQDVGRLVGNTKGLSWRDRVRYVGNKARTRSVRYGCLLLSRLGVRTLPSALKVAWDVNLMAFQEYRPAVSAGRLVLFRATEQDFASGPKDLGWGGLFEGGVEIHEVESDHERIFLQPALGVLAGLVGEALRAAQGGRVSGMRLAASSGERRRVAA